MSSPLLIANTPVKVVGKNTKRFELFLQNVGKDDIYFKKQPLSGVINEPSVSNYDFILFAKENKGDGRIKIRSIASFRAVGVGQGASTPTCTLAYMETSLIEIC